MTLLERIRKFKEQYENNPKFLKLLEEIKAQIAKIKQEDNNADN